MRLFVLDWNGFCLILPPPFRSFSGQVCILRRIVPAVVREQHLHCLHRGQGWRLRGWPVSAALLGVDERTRDGKCGWHSSRPFAHVPSSCIPFYVCVFFDCCLFLLHPGVPLCCDKAFVYMSYNTIWVQQVSLSSLYLTCPAASFRSVKPQAAPGDVDRGQRRHEPDDASLEDPPRSGPGRSTEDTLGDKLGSRATACGKVRRAICT